MKFESQFYAKTLQGEPEEANFHQVHVSHADKPPQKPKL